MQGAWRFRWIAIAAATALATAGWLIVFALSDWYGAAAAVLVNTRTALTPALKDLAVEPDVSVQLNYVRESLLAGPQLRRIAQLTGMLAAAGADPARQEEVLSNLRKRIQLTVQNNAETGSSAGTSYGIHYQDTDRARALKVVNILLTTLVDETLGGKRQGAQNAQRSWRAKSVAMKRVCEPPRTGWPPSSQAISVRCPVSKVATSHCCRRRPGPSRTCGPSCSRPSPAAALLKASSTETQRCWPSLPRPSRVPRAWWGSTRCRGSRRRRLVSMSCCCNSPTRIRT